MDKHTVKLRLFGKLSIQRLIRSALLVYGVVGAWAYFYSDRLIFLPSPSSYTRSDDLTFLTTANNTQIAALHLPNPTATYTILYSHGNAEDIGENRSRMEWMRDMGFSILIYDYPGYGLSGGKPSVPGTIQAIDAAYAYLTETLKIPGNRIIVYGRSVGGGPAVDLASRQPVAGLVVESSFTSTFRVKVPFPLFPFDKFPNQQKIQRVQSPVLIIHGDQDQTIPFSQGQQLYQAAPGPKLSLWIPGGDHNNLLAIAGASYQEKLQEFQDLIEQQPQQN
ncbi:MAG: alpha/beta hydrolase [Oscillatoriales cyanobacterium RM2_1_1]|nr:alpha/beta hydrolase [Oscillatoriales cyanobacterium SM2_3_0]NJO46208.1 alpha/beta hydrolase [Oscillatoriales cyanobacterium RM2_1_1]